MTDQALTALSDSACNPKSSRMELRRVALVAIGELSMLRTEYARLKEQGATPSNHSQQVAA